MMSLQRIGVFLDLRLDIYLKSHQGNASAKAAIFSFVDFASLKCIESWKRVYRMSTSLAETVSAWSAKFLNKTVLK